MKKALTMIGVLMGACLSYAQTPVTVADITIPQNGETELVISYDFPSEGLYTGYSLVLSLPEGVSLAQNDKGKYAYTLGDCHEDTHQLTINYKEDSGEYGLGCLSLESDPLTGTSGVLLTLTVKADGSQPAGNTLQATVKEVNFAKLNGQTDFFTDAVPFTVTIGEPVDSRVVLDEKSTTVPEASSGAVDVRVNRTLVAGNWNTICLPFAMTGSQVTSAFGNDVQLADFSDWTIEEDGEGNIVRIVISFENVAATGGMEANHPYLIKVSQPVTEFTADGVTITPEEEPMTMVKHGTKKRDPESYMIGTYAANTVLDEFMLFLNGNKFWYSSGLTKMKAFRAYFNIYDILTSVENAEAKVFFIFAETTGIKNVNDGDEDGNIDDSWYTIDGQKLNREPVQKGIYIHQGKKINK